MKLFNYSMALYESKGLQKQVEPIPIEMTKLID